MFQQVCIICAALIVTFAQIPKAIGAEPAPAIDGDWTGTLTTPQGDMRLWITVTRDESGALSAVLESVDQAPGQKIPTSDIKADAGNFSFRIPMIGASYAATWNTEKLVWDGIFKQGLELPLILKRGMPTAKTTIAGMDGRWLAVLNRGGKDLRLVIKLKTTSAGTAVAFDALDAPAYNIPVANFTREGNSVSFGIPAAGVTFEGGLNVEGNAFTGLWQHPQQPDTTLTFTLQTEKTAALRRPQNPVGQLPYRSEEVSIENKEAALTLAGTLTLPEGKGPFAAAILISGSGASDRDESFMGHKPFLVLSDHLTRAGIAVLRYDDRGTGASTGDYSSADSRDFAADANAAFSYLAAQPEIDANKIGFIGHSEGGLIAPIALQSNKRAAYMVMLAGPGTPIPQLILSQARLAAEASGATDAEMEPMLTVSRQIIETVRTHEDTAALSDALDALLSDETLARMGVNANQRVPMKARFMSPWYRFFVQYDPADYLPSINIPMLAVGGSLDLQVPSEENLAGIRTLMAGKPDVTVTMFPKLNHLFQTADTGAMGEYRDIEETFAPHALNAVSNWINKRFGKAS